MCGSCYHNPDASLATTPTLLSMSWFGLLSSGILRTKDGNRFFLASPSGAKEDKEEEHHSHSPLHLTGE